MIIQHGSAEYSLLAHLRRGSVSVRVGEAVTRGQPVGECGNSGFSTVPHLHFQVQDRPDFFTSLGLPAAFVAGNSAAGAQAPEFARTGDLVSGYASPE